MRKRPQWPPPEDSGSYRKNGFLLTQEAAWYRPIRGFFCRNLKGETTVKLYHNLTLQGGFHAETRLQG